VPTIIKYSKNYEINESGEIFRLTTQWGNTCRIKINPTLGKNGYYMVTLWTGGKSVTKYLHRLLAEHFLENPLSRRYVCHKNDIKTDNRLENLYWGTQIQNSGDAIRNGKVRKCEQHGQAKLTVSQVVWIRDMANRNIYSNRKMAKILNMSPSGIDRVVNNSGWRI